MKNRVTYIEPLILATLALGLFVLGSLFPDIVIALPHRLSKFASERSAVIRTIMVIYGVALTASFITSVIVIQRYGSSIFAKLVESSRSLVREAYAMCRWLYWATQIRGAAVWLLLMMAVGIGVRCYFLTQPMRYDEAVTFLNFVNKGLHQMFYYPLPNNHVLHTLLVRLSVALFGSHPASIRLPAFLAGVLVIPASFILSRLLTRSPRSGYLAGALVAVFPHLILYDTMARGYSLLILLSLCLAMLCYRLIEYPSTHVSFLMASTISLGLLDMPSFLFPAAGLVLWAVAMLVREGHEPIWVLVHVLVPLSIMTMVLTGLFYTPTILVSNGVQTLIANRFVEGLSWSRFLNRLPRHISVSVSRSIRGIPSAVSLGIALLSIIGLVSLVWKRRWTALTLFPLLVIGGAVVLFAKHAIPFARTWIYFVPFIATIADVGFIAIIPEAAGVHVRRVLLLLASGAALLLMSQGTVAALPATGYFPEALAVVEILSNEMNPQDKVVVRLSADAPVRFYMWYLNVPQEGDSANREAPAKTFFVVKPSQYTLTDLTNQNARRVVRIGDAELYVVEAMETTGMLEDIDAVTEGDSSQRNLLSLVDGARP